MAGTTCHEMNQPMQRILGQTQLLSFKTSEDETKRVKIDIILEEINRMADITSRIMKMSKYKTVDYLEGKIIDIND